MQSDLLDFKYLWDGSAPEWALLNIEPQGEACYLIVNTETKSAKLIEDEHVFAEVVNQMLSAKTRVVWRGNGF
jgi:hypothetical protein